MKVKKYLITSGIGLIFVAILSFVLFKYTAPKSEIINLIPNKFTNIIDIKPNKFFIQTVSKFSYTKNNILALSGVKRITLWQYKTGNSLYTLAFIKPKIENIKNTYKFLKNIGFKTGNDYIAIKKQNIIVYGQKETIDFWKSYKGDYVNKNKQISDFLKKDYQLLVIGNLQNLLNTTENSNYQLEIAYLKTFSKNFKYGLIYSQFKQDETDVNFQILFSKDLNNLKNSFVNSNIYKFFDKSDYTFVSIGDLFKLLDVKKENFSYLLKSLRDTEAGPLFSSLYSNEDFKNLLNGLSTWAIKIGSGDNPLNMGIAIIFSGDYVYNFALKAFPYMEEWAKNYGSGKVKLIKNTNKFGLTTLFPYKGSFINTNLTIEKGNGWTFIKIFNPIIKSQKENLKIEKGIINFYINLGRILNLVDKLGIINPYLTPESKLYLENLKILGNFNLNQKSAILKLKFIKK